jgi:hypothetical protein
LRYQSLLAQGLCGKMDWRMPAVDELMTLVYCSDGKYEKDGSCTYRSVFAPSINSTYFPNTSVYEYWSSSPLANYSSHAWDVLFYYGYSGYYYKDYVNFVRLVR